MDFAAWQSRFDTDPSAPAAIFRERCAALPTAQQAAIWATPPDSSAWTAAAAAIDDTALPLRGVPFAIKDLFHLAGQPTRSGGILRPRRPKADGTLVARLRALGAIPVGKTHLHEFAYGLTGENQHYGQVEHPHFPGHDAGGSSSGSAAAVAAGLVPFALGTDTGGSLRVPAAFCGLYSWRETPHHAFIADAFPLAPSFDTAGWLTRSATDLRTLHTALRGTFPTSAQTPRGAWVPPSVFGVTPRDYYAAALDETAARFTSETLAADDLLCRTFKGTNAAYSILQSTEAYAVHQDDLDRHRDDYGEAVWGRIDRGRRWTAAQVDDAQVKAMRVRLAFARTFEDYDFLILPVSTQPSPPTGALDQSLRDALLDFTTPVSLAGLPALTVPVPLPNGFSLGVHIVFPSRHSAALDWVLSRCESC
ncbi:amidase [Actomonas aquatica]|uniref:Amidase n=1 Tax=Actomonas aquatica TaxID=2866162 RepID=A0ABZ1C998_9BACT|nr:amidase [Opitutus sp. WL0086]WRQ88086.1 amidase [Opitutus sp. WL0086]